MVAMRKSCSHCSLYHILFDPNQLQFVINDVFFVTSTAKRYSIASNAAFPDTNVYTFGEL